MAFQVGLVCRTHLPRPGDLRDMWVPLLGREDPRSLFLPGNLMDRGAWPQFMGSRKESDRPSNLAHTPVVAEGTTTGPLGAETQQKDTFVPCPHPAPV